MPAKTHEGTYEVLFTFWRGFQMYTEKSSFNIACLDAGRVFSEGETFELTRLPTNKYTDPAVRVEDLRKFSTFRSSDVLRLLASGLLKKKFVPKVIDGTTQNAQR